MAKNMEWTSKAYTYIRAFFGYHHVLMILLTITFIFIPILLAGCHPSGGFHNVYLLSLRDTAARSAAENATTELSRAIVRAGYFGICVQEDIHQPWSCGRNDLALRTFASSEENGASRLIEIASHYTHDVAFSGLFIGGLALVLLCWIGLATFPSWHEVLDDWGSEIEVKPFPSRPVSQACAFAVGLAAAFFLVAALWQHLTAVTTLAVVSAVTDGEVKGSVGAAAMALGWVAFAITTVVLIALVVMISSIHLLDKLTED